MSDKKLVELADGCNNGACNVGGLLRSFSKAIDEMGDLPLREHPALPIILGQLSYLIGESAGPTEFALNNYTDWRAAYEEDKELST
jgi:hypothetical protein